MSRYWAYTIKFVPRKDLPTAEAQKAHDDFLEYLKVRGEEYRSSCMEEWCDGYAGPEDIIHEFNWLFSHTPLEILVDKRLISKEEFDAWREAVIKLAKYERAYIRGERDTAPEW